MKTRFESSFQKDLTKIKDKKLLQQIKSTIFEIKQASKPLDLNKILKLKGYETYYRIRLGNYRIGIEIINDEVIFTRILHRNTKST